MVKKKKLENSFAEPTIDNVELGDFVVAHLGGKKFLAPVSGIREDYFVASSKHFSTSCNYEDSVVLKANGIYLIGRNVKFDL